ERPLVASLRLLQPALILQDDAQVVVGLGQVRPELERPQVAGLRLLPLSLVVPYVGQVIVGLGKVRPELERPLEPAPCSSPRPQLGTPEQRPVPKPASAHRLCLPGLPLAPGRTVLPPLARTP